MNFFEPEGIQPLIEAIEIEFGEIARSYDEVPRFEQLIKGFGYPNVPKLFGWGVFHESARDIFDLGIAAAKRTLARAQLAPQDVDLLIFCSTCFPGDEIAHIGFNVRLFSGLALKNAFPIGITLNNCTSLLNALSLANNLVGSGRYRNILVITADKVYHDDLRMTNFALLSDSAASCLVTARDVTGYALVAEAFHASEDPIDDYRGVDDSPLYTRVFSEVMQRSGLAPSDIRQIFSSNIFRSVTLLKERKLGLQSKQIFLDNVARHGHCFAADSFVNLSTYEAEHDAESGEHFMLSADAPNLRASLVLRRVVKATQDRLRDAADLVTSDRS